MYAKHSSKNYTLANCVKTNMLTKMLALLFVVCGEKDLIGASKWSEFIDDSYTTTFMTSFDTCDAH